MTRQTTDDEVLRVLDEARMHMEGRLNSAGAREITDARLAEARATVAALQAERDALRNERDYYQRESERRREDYAATSAVFVANEAKCIERAERAESALEALRGQVAGLGNSLREMLELREATQAGRLTERHELEIVRDARAALLAIKERMG